MKSVIRIALLGSIVALPTACREEAGADLSVADNLASRVANVSRGTERPYRNVEGAMPNVRYEADGERIVTYADLYVRGSVSAVEQGRSKSFSDPEADSGESVPFNDPSADTSTIELNVDVEKSITDGVIEAPGEQVRVGIALNAPVDVDAAREEFASYGEMVFLLYQPSSVLADDRALWAVMEDGTFMGYANDSGTLSFPALRDDTGSELAPDDLTVDDLESPDQPGPIDLVTVDGELTRE